jgi:hypothetical protein
MERILGRPLLANEDVHHKDHNPLNNAVENLEVMTRIEHIALHAREKQIYPDQKTCVVCGATFMANPRKRKRQKCCGAVCAQTVRVVGRKYQARRSRPSSSRQ